MDGHGTDALLQIRTVQARMRCILWGAVWGAVWLSIAASSCSALSYRSFGKGVNAYFGPEDGENPNPAIIVDIYVPTSGKMLDIDLAVDIQHTSICDLQIYIKSPTSDFLCINSYDVYNFQPGLQNLRWAIFDAEASSVLDTSSQGPFGGLYKPNGPDSLTSLYGGQTQGLWQVMVYDGVYLDTGTLKVVRLDFYINPEPAAIVVFALGGIIVVSSGQRALKKPPV